MDFKKMFDEMRPYNDNEVPQAIQRVIQEDHFKHMASFLYKDKSVDEIISIFKSVQTVEDFQTAFSSYAVREIIRQTSKGLTTSGIENLDQNSSYLFIANHRDIVLDSAIMQVVLFDNKHKTSEITFGSNLMSSEFIVDLGKLNKMFTFYRGGSKLQMYKNALLHSAYIRHVISEKHTSVWIAQRDGRTKDGNDKTQAALIKMLTIGSSNVLKSIEELNIVPVTISYEYEPCDNKKVLERYISQREIYKKVPGEDVASILAGITENKGRIHIDFGVPLNKSLQELENVDLSQTDLVELVVDELDNQMHKRYALWSGNYVAYDLFRGLQKYTNIKYSAEEKQIFLDFIESRVVGLPGDKEELKQMLIEMYARPVINQRKAELYKEEDL